MPEPLVLTLSACPTCAGFGVRQEKTGTITCTVCNGRGMWMQTVDGKTLFYPMPEFVHMRQHESTRMTHAVQLGLAGLSITVTSATGLYLVLTSLDNLGAVIWMKGVVHFIFGVSGLISMGALTHLKNHHTSTASLHELPGDIAIASPDKPLDLSPYANPRVALLIGACAETANEYHSPYVDEAILLITLLRQPRIGGMLGRLEHDVANVIEAVVPFISQRGGGSVTGAILQPVVRERIYAGLEEALSHDFPYLDLEDILLGYADKPGIFTEVFANFGLGYDEVYAVTRWYASEQERMHQWAFWLEKGRTRPKGFMNKAWTALPTPLLDQYSVDLTRQAGNGALSAATTRTAELQSIMQVLGRTKKNNVLLIGEPGVGKSTVLGALALRMIEENVPEILKDKRLISLDVASLLSSDGQQKMSAVLDEIVQAGNVILAVPEVQSLVSGGSLDASNLLSSALDRAYIQVVSTATYVDYHRYVESNATLTSLLEVIEIKEMSTEEAVSVLEEESPAIENRQKVFLTYPALTAAATLAKRYIPDRVLPDSALSLLDEAAAAVAQRGERWVQKSDVESTLEKKTNIPIQEADSREADLLLHMEDTLHERIIGQEQAIKVVAESLRRARAGLQDARKPINSFLFVGPTGVGKTETAKAVADLYFGSAEAMIRLDMSEYQDPTSVYRLIGAPAASSDSFTEGGALTQPIREHPFSLLLLDEIEKANTDVLNLFLQLLDDGRLTENTGRTVQFNNSMIVATSNAGSLEIMQLLTQGLAPKELTAEIMKVLQKHFKPEFINRFDAVVPFYPLRPEEVDKVVGVMLERVVHAAAEQKIAISFTPEAITKLGVLGYDPQYGARPLRRVIQDKVEGLLANLILEKKLVSGQSLQIGAEMIN
jgi:ATP-dependent Clp protease ATP-binding subunit ClpC